MYAPTVTTLLTLFLLASSRITDAEPITEIIDITWGLDDPWCIAVNSSGYASAKEADRHNTAMLGVGAYATQADPARGGVRSGAVASMPESASFLGTSGGPRVSSGVVNPGDDLTITKIDSADPVVAGTNLTYTVTVLNNGISNADNVVVSDTLPAEVTPASTTGCIEDPRGVPTCTLGIIEAGTSKQYAISVTVDASTIGVITNNASVTADFGSADLSILKIDEPDPIIAGDLLTYTIHVQNSGPSAAESVVVTDLLPTGVTPLGTSGCAEDPTGVPTCTLGVIAANETREYLILGAVDTSFQPGTVILNQASVTSSTVDPDESNNNTLSETVVDQALTIVKIADSDPVVAGDLLTYEVRVVNVSSTEISDVVVVDALPEQVTLVEGSGCTEDSPGVLTCNLGTIAAREPVSFTIAVRVDASASGTLTNVATVFPGNISTSEATVVVPSSSQIGRSSSASDRNDGDIRFLSGSRYSAPLRVSPLSDTMSNNKILCALGAETGLLPTGVDCDPVTGCDGEFLELSSRSLHTIAANSTELVAGAANIDVSMGDHVKGNNSTSEDTTVIAEADLAITKIDSQDPIPAGSSLLYTVTVTNNGPSDATNVEANRYPSCGSHLRGNQWLSQPILRVSRSATSAQLQRESRRNT